MTETDGLALRAKHDPEAMREIHDTFLPRYKHVRKKYPSLHPIDADSAINYALFTSVRDFKPGKAPFGYCLQKRIRCNLRDAARAAHRRRLRYRVLPEERRLEPEGRRQAGVEHRREMTPEANLKLAELRAEIVSVINDMPKHHVDMLMRCYFGDERPKDPSKYYGAITMMRNRVRDHLKRKGYGV